MFLRNTDIQAEDYRVLSLLLRYILASCCSRNNIFIYSLYATHFIQRICVLLKNTTCFCTFQPSSGVVSLLF
jgi:hypothetical protein